MKAEEVKSLVMKVTEESEKAGLKLNIQKTKIMASVHMNKAAGKIIALTIRAFVGKGLLFNILSRFVIAFLPRSMRPLISWLQSPSAVILEPKKIVSHCFLCFSIYLP